MPLTSLSYCLEVPLPGYSSSLDLKILPQPPECYPVPFYSVEVPLPPAWFFIKTFFITP